MARTHYDLPSLTSLASFDAAARHLSFKSAAQELNVTPGAVSHQVKSLETAIGVALFTRLHRGVELTPKGSQLAVVLQSSLSEVASVITRMRRGEGDATVTIGATTAVSSLWLTPRLSRFWKTHGGIAVNQLVSDVPNVGDNNIDISIKYGNPNPDDSRNFSLFSDRLIPVCSPEFAAQNSSNSLDDISRCKLIHLSAADERWTSWGTWFQNQGHLTGLSHGVSVNNYSIALQAAKDGQGLVLGWERLIKPLLDSGELVPFGTYRIGAPYKFYIQLQSKEVLTENVQIVLDWLLTN